MPQAATASRDHFFHQPQPQHTSQIPHFQPTHRYNNSTSRVGNAYTATAANFVTPYNPQISPLSTSNNTSPTSPKSQYHTRQVRPLYIPAVLRPNEHPSREVSSKAKPRGKADPDGDSYAAGGEGAVDDEDEEDAEGRRVMRSSGSFISMSGLGAFGFGRLSRRTTNDSAKCVDGAWNLDLFPEVTELPSRDHWKVSVSS